MSIKRFFAWVRLILTVLIIVSAIIVILGNQDNKTDLWVLFHTFKQIPVIWLILVTAGVTLVGFWIIKGVYKAYRDVKQKKVPVETQTKLPSS